MRAKALRALKVNLGVVVVVKHRGVPVAVDTPAAIGEKFCGHGSGIVPVHAEFNGRLGESVGKVFHPNGQADARYNDSYRDDPAIRGGQSN